MHRRIPTTRRRRTPRETGPRSPVPVAEPLEPRLLLNGSPFVAADPVPAGYSPGALLAADLDNNGETDLAVANFLLDNDVSVLLGTGNGEFPDRTDYPVQQSPMGLEAGDFNGDERTDLVVANELSSSITVLYGQPDGGLANPTHYQVGLFPQAVKAADFDGDDRTDLVISNDWDGDLTFLFGQADGFGGRQDVAVGGSPQRVAVGDFDGDDDLDVAAANYDDNTVSVLYGRGDGGFVGRVDYDVGASPRGLACADLDGDGQLDLVATNRWDPENHVTVLYGQGGGVFGDRTDLVAGEGGVEVLAEDLDQDGRLDLVTANNHEDTLSILYGQPARQWADPETYAVGDGPTGLAAADFNNDGWTDLAVSNQGDQNVSVLICAAEDAAAPTATLDHPQDGAAVTESEINVDQRHIDVTFNDVGTGLNVSTVTDAGQEFALSGAAADGVTVDGAATLVGGTTFRYSFTGDFSAGQVGVDFAAGAWADNAGNTSEADTQQFTVTADPVAGIGEAGAVTFAQAGPDHWRTVALDGSYADPVVVCSPVSYGGAAPSTVRVRNVASDSFELQVDEWDYLDGAHAEETIGYLVMEAGRYVLPDGRLVEAGVADGVDHNWLSIDYAGAFPGTPVVVSQTMSSDGSDAVVTRQRNVRPDGLDVRLQEQEDGSGTHLGETVGYVAIQPGRGDAGESARTLKLYGDEWRAIRFADEHAAEPVFLAAMQTFDGANTAALRQRWLNGDWVQVRVEEEASRDVETAHCAETIGYATFAPGAVAGEPAPVGAPDDAVGETGRVTVSQDGADQWHTVHLGGTYADPVVVLSPLSYEGAQQAVPRVRNVASSRFEFQIDEWDYLDGGHVAETVSYVVMESGRHVLPDGRVVEAGNLAAVDHDWQAVSFAQAFAAAPTVLSQAVSFDGPDAVVTRQRGIDADGFDVRLQEQQTGGTHLGETVSWIAVEQGFDTDGEAGATPDAVTHDWHTLTFRQGYAGPPVMLAAMQSFDGSDTAGLRYRDLGTDAVQLFVEEESSYDGETRHCTETVGYALFAPGWLTAPAAAAGPVATVMTDTGSLRSPGSVSSDSAQQNGKKPLVVDDLLSTAAPENISARRRGRSNRPARGPAIRPDLPVLASVALEGAPAPRSTAPSVTRRSSSALSSRDHADVPGLAAPAKLRALRDGIPLFERL